MGDAGANLATAIIEGMARGLYAGVGRVVDAAKNVAESALHSAEHFLGINSPSKEFKKLGIYSGEGYSEGLEESISVVEASAALVGKAAILSMQKSISNIAVLASEKIDLSPVIRPVVDMSAIDHLPYRLAQVLTFKPIEIKTNVSNAGQAAYGVAANQEAQALQAQATQTIDNSVKFEQYNTSPKALSEIDIYRQTKNLISAAKEN